jgi:hypothetical protein
MSTTKVQATQEQEVTPKGRVEQKEQQEAINKALDETKHQKNNR